MMINSAGALQISNFNSKRVESFLVKLLSYDEYIILGHEGPDGDCLGSQQALNSFLQSKNKKTYLCSAGPFKRAEVLFLKELFCDTLPEKDKLSKNCAVILVDCSTLSRTGWKNITEYEDLPLLIIDHHKSASDKGENSLILDFSPSTTLIIQMLIENSGRDISNDEAEAIFFGFATDTGFFRHLEPHHSWVFDYVARMTKTGISPNYIYKMMNPGKPISTQIHFGSTLSSAVASCNGKVITAFESYKDIERLNVTERSADQLYESLQNISDSQVIILLKEESENHFSVSLRSSNSVDVSKIAKIFDGGGHAKASGFSFEGSSDKLLQKLIKLIKPELEE